MTARRAKMKSRLGFFAMVGATLAMSGTLLGPVAHAGFTDHEFVEVDGIGSNFPSTGGGASLEPGYGLDTSVAVDGSGNVWVWGFYGLRRLDNTGMDGGWNGGVNGAPGRSGVNNGPQIVKGIGCVQSAAASAYAVMAIDCYGNIYGWGDNTQNGHAGPADRYGGQMRTHVGGGDFGMYKDGYIPTEGLPNKINQANPAESIDTWRPIDGPGAPIGSYPGGDNTAKVVQVVSNEYGFAYLKEDGTVWTVGDANWGARGQGKAAGRAENPNGYPVGSGVGVALRPTQVKFPGDRKISDLWGGYESYNAVAEDGETYFWGRSRNMSSSLENNEIMANSNACSALAPVYHEYICFSPVATPRVTQTIKDNGGYKYARGGYQFSAMLTGNGKLFTWGAATYRSGAPEMLNNRGDAAGRAQPAVLDTNDVTGKRIVGEDVTAVFTNYSSGVFIKSNGEVWGWGCHEWGGAFSSNLETPRSTRDHATPVNYADAPGLIWDPARDPQKRKGVSVGGHKDGAVLTLSDGTSYSWGENGGGAACGGTGYGVPCYNEFGAPRQVGGGGIRNTGGLYIWPATPVESIQNIVNNGGSSASLAISKTAYPFEGTAVKTDDIVEYTVDVKNGKSATPAVSIEDTVTGGTMVEGSFKAVFKTADETKDVTSDFTVTSTGFTRASKSVPAEGTLVVTYKVTVTGTSGQTLSSVATLKNSSGAVINTSKTENPIS